MYLLQRFFKKKGLNFVGHVLEIEGSSKTGQQLKMDITY